MNHYYTNQPEIESAPEWITFKLRGKELVFQTDNGVFSKKTIDFGSRVLIESIPKEWLSESKKLLDVGCGYGPMGIALGASASHLVIDQVDVNLRALDLTRSNRQKNGITNGNVWESNVYDAVQTVDYDLIVTNPPIRAGKKVVHQILIEAYNHLTEGGRLICVIQKKQGAPSALKKMEEIFTKVNELTREKGYWILVGEK
ncbi:class I SAM-dependent methyltransferase [Atopobacter phocae]|uniref:class I SAM-dependent methyltransferase n=1 Tax=Atopobacter phocae TaxID=136492 RepID=UPI0004727D3B|nr:class I SAM-dependent methyltransferase [Atopobacter phocae]